MLINFHLELNSLIEYFNDQRAFRRTGLDPYKILEAARDMLINTGQVPFLSKSESNTSYYQKYVQLWHFNDKELVPEFYFMNEDIYDLDVPMRIIRDENTIKKFPLFFIIKIDEISKQSPDFLHEYFDFQLYDNFYGDINFYIEYLHDLPKIAPNFKQLPAIVQDWINKQAIKDIKTKDIITEWSDFLSSKKGYKIPSKLTEEQIRHFFTLLYEEKNDGNSFLLKDEYNIIFQNGFTIPQDTLEKKIKLNYNTIRSKKVVDCAIHKFYENNSTTWQDKADYILFFAHFIEDYAAALNSRHDLTQILSNITGRAPKRWPINWDLYLPK
ncbi:MAG: hypothetical protein ACK55K_07650 [Bacteroidota bacterium]